MVDPSYCLDRVVPGRVSQVSRWMEVGNHTQRALKTRLSSDTSTGTFAVSTGPYINYSVRKLNLKCFLHQFKKWLENQSSCFEPNISFSLFFFLWCRIPPTPARFHEAFLVACAPTFHNVIMPSMPTPPTFTLKLFLDFVEFSFVGLFLLTFSNHRVKFTTNLNSAFEHIELPATWKLLDYFLRSNKSNIKQLGKNSRQIWTAMGFLLVFRPGNVFREHWGTGAVSVCSFSWSLFPYGFCHTPTSFLWHLRI